MARRHRPTGTVLRGIVLATLALLIGDGSESFGQAARSAVPWGRLMQHDSTGLQPEGEIHSVPCDPLMSLSQEQELLRRLKQPCPFYWYEKTTLSELATDVSTVVPLIVDRKALEEIGLNPDLELGGGAPLESPPEPDARETSTTPQKVWTAQSDQRIETAALRESEPKWYDAPAAIRPKATTRAGFHPSLLVAMITRLEGNDLTIMIRDATVKITTTERAEEEPVTRLYDVAAILGGQTQTNPVPGQRRAWAGQAGFGQVHGRREFALDSLMDSIQTSVDPDTWEMLGGNSTMTPTFVRGRKWLIVRTTTMTHWKIQRLLDRLNH